MDRIVGRWGARAVKTAKQASAAKHNSAPLYDAEFVDTKNFRAAAFSPRTLATRWCHLRQIAKALRKAGKAPAESKMRKVLVKSFDTEGIGIATQFLLEKRIKTAPAYLKTWKNFAKREFSPANHLLEQLELGVRALRRQIGNLSVQQAPEFRLKQMQADLGKDKASPLVKGGPIYQRSTAVVSSVFMLRGISARSMLLEQLEVNEDEKTVSLELRKRKGVVDAKPHHVVLGCICEWTAVCPYCVTHQYLKRRRLFAGKYLFINGGGGPVSRTGLLNTYKNFTEYACSQVPRPHSSRVTGAREWVRLGVSLETTASIGAWTDVKTLKYYVGAAVMSMRVKKELAGSRSDTTSLEAKINDLSMKVTALGANRQSGVEARTCGSGRRHLSGAGEPSDNNVSQILPMVRVGRRPWRWHQIRSAEGAADRWVTECGEGMNMATMSLKTWSSRTEGDPFRDKCSKKVANKLAVI